MNNPNLGLFWMSLAVTFFVLAIVAFRFRNRVQRIAIRTEEQTFIQGGVQARDLQTIANHILLVEAIGFILAGSAGVVEILQSFSII